MLEHLFSDRLSVKALQDLFRYDILVVQDIQSCCLKMFEDHLAVSLHIVSRSASFSCSCKPAV